MTQTWKQERPSWCPHPDCLFRRRAMDDICGGKLPAPEPHDGDHNTMRLCLNGADSTGAVFDLQVNDSDLHWLRWIFEGMQKPEPFGSPCVRCGVLGSEHDPANHPFVEGSPDLKSVGSEEK